MDYTDDYDCDIDTQDEFKFSVPQFPKLKHPNNSPQRDLSSVPCSSTQDASSSKSSVNYNNIFEGDSNPNIQEKQILLLIYQFKKSNGIAKRELECNIIRNLIRQKKIIDLQEQYMISSQWTNQYTSYLYDNNLTKPQRIDNCPLFDEKIIDQFKTNLHNRDFVLVNVSVWLFLKEEYSGGPEASFEIYQKQTKGLLNKVDSPQISPYKTQQRAHSTDTSISAKQQSQKKSPQKAIFEIPLVGFKNELYFCYMNSGLQSLLSLPDFNFFILKFIKQYYRESNQKSTQTNIETTLSYVELIDLILHNEQKDYIKIGALKAIVSKKFNPRKQHDCQEFLQFLLSQIEDELKAYCKEIRRIHKSKNLEVNMVQYFFKGLIESKIQCNSQKCLHATSVVEEFLTLSLALKAQSLEDCLNDFFKDEKVKDYKCEKCNKSNCVKLTSLQQQPRNIIFHIKRFQFFPKAHKLSQIVTFPMDNLSLQKYYHKSKTLSTYKLRAVAVHQGNLDSGHYYSFGRRFQQWYQFNDESVRKISKKDLLNQQAYLLFYSQNSNIE